MKLLQKLSPLFNVLSGKEGKRVAAGAIFSIVAEAVAIGVGITAAVGTFPVSALFFSGGLVVAGASLGFATASSISQGRRIKSQDKKLKKQAKKLKTVTELEKEILADEKILIDAQKKSAPVSAPKNPTP